MKTKTQEINWMAMELVGELQTIPPEQAYQKVIEYLTKAWQRGAEESKNLTSRNCQNPNFPLDALSVKY